MKLITYNEKTYDLTVYKTDQFKTSTIDFVFSVPNTEQDITNIVFLKELLQLSSKNYPSFRAISIKLEKLYNANYNVSILKKSNSIDLVLNLNIINDQYTEENNADHAIEFIFDLINNPNITNNQIDKKTFDLIINRLNNHLLKIKENPNVVASNNFINYLDPNSFFATKLIGDEKTIKALTPKSVASYYQNFFQRAAVKIFAVGDFEAEHLNNIIMNSNKFVANAFIKPEIMPLKVDEKISKKIIDQGSFEQSVLLTYVKVDNETFFDTLTTGVVFNKIFGNGTNNKLFRHVREENSLCYSISCDLYHYLQAFFISSGINKKDFNKVIALIKSSLEEMQQGNFTEEDMIQAKKQIHFSYEMIYDSVYSICNMIENEPIHNYPNEEELIDDIMKTTKEDIIEYANNLTIITNYLLAEDSNAKKDN